MPLADGPSIDSSAFERAPKLKVAVHSSRLRPLRGWGFKSFQPIIRYWLFGQTHGDIAISVADPVTQNAPHTAARSCRLP
jgi:hypothetical protein